MITNDKLLFELAEGLDIATALAQHAWAVKELSTASARGLTSSCRKALEAAQELELRAQQMSDYKCPACGCLILPVLSKREPVGTPGPVRATCQGCGRKTDYYEPQTDAISAWMRGKWAEPPVTPGKVGE
jgi:hypothetical protein